MTAQRRDGWCTQCHKWFAVWPSPLPEQDTECPVCRTPADTVIPVAPVREAAAQATRGS
jgi:hypothetical protein